MIILFNFDEEDWQNHPLVCIQEGLPFGSTQSGAYLELGMKEVAKATDDHMAKFIILYFRAVDNLLYSFRSKEELYKVGYEINRIMTQHNFPLQIPFSTSQAHHNDFT